MTEAPLCRNEHVFVIGGANSAGQAAMYLSEYAAKVTMLVRASNLKGTMSHYLSDRILEHPKIAVLFNAEVTQLDGKAALEAFVCIGGAPNTE